MRRRVLKWHEDAVADFIAMLRYSNKVFGRGVAKEFRATVLHNVELLRTHPNLGRKDMFLTGNTTLEYRTLLVYTHVKLVYTVHVDYIYIHLLWDVRQEEKRLFKLIDRRYKSLGSEDINELNEPAMEYGGKER